MSLELLIGPMFAGKSSAIQSIIRRHQALGWKVFVITHSVDTRYSETPVVANHDRITLPAVGSERLLPLLDSQDFKQSSLVIIEEAQFFEDLVPFVQRVVDELWKHVVVVGLDGDAQRKPFGHVLDLIPYCDKVTKLTAMCRMCRDGTPAIFTYKHEQSQSEGQVCVGGQETYTPLCRKHYHAMRNPVAVSPSPQTDIDYVHRYGC